MFQNIDTMKFFEAKFTTIVYRLYLMMAVVIISFTTGYFGFALLALPIFLSAMLGVKIQFRANKTLEAKNVKIEIDSRKVAA